ncbi:hypothetical protein WMY93_011849 [Mugilogobius chulae]|uniref:Uncharacterized protein n=1 Tax=Mugilogobius chulae TaxID=88201 RepID=A0AAW0PFY1_9GOBI
MSSRAQQRGTDVLFCLIPVILVNHTAAEHDSKCKNRTVGGIYTGSQTAVVSLVSSEQKLSKMCAKLVVVRALMQERLTAAAEEIFALVERTIAEFADELRRSKEENQRKQQLLDSLLKPQLHTAAQGVQTDSVKQQIPETPQIKEEPEEQRLKQEEEQLPEFTAECVKSEEQQQTDNSSDTDNDEDWEPPASSSTAQMKTEADGDDYNQGPKHQQGRTCQELKQQQGRTCQGLKQQQGRTCQGLKQQQGRTCQGLKQQQGRTCQGLKQQHMSDFVQERDFTVVQFVTRHLLK